MGSNALGPLLRTAPTWQLQVAVHRPLSPSHAEGIFKGKTNQISHSIRKEKNDTAMSTSWPYLSPQPFPAPTRATSAAAASTPTEQGAAENPMPPAVSATAAAAPADARWLVHNGRTVGDKDKVPLSGRQMLEMFPKGAYTTTRTIEGGTRVILWDCHMARFADSLRRIARECPQLFPALSAADVSNDNVDISSITAEKLGALMLPSLRELGRQVAASDWRRRREVEGKEKRVEGQKEEELCLTMLACGEDPFSEDRGREGGGGSREYPQPSPSFHLLLHASPLLLPPIVPMLPLPPPAAAAVMGPGRTMAAAKYSEWPLLRRNLERCRPAGVREVLLSNDGDKLLEGLITNFYILRSRQNGGGMELQTAPLDDGILPGTIRRTILEVCIDLGIPINETTPALSERDTWHEAFITNSASILEPLSSLHLPATWHAGIGQDQWQPSNEWEEWTLRSHSEKDPLNLTSTSNITTTIWHHLLHKLIQSSVPLK